MAVLELEGISKHYGAIYALNDVSLTLNAGEVVGLVGDNGAGKSTLVKIIAGNFHPTHGAIKIEAVAEQDFGRRRANSRVKRGVKAALNQREEIAPLMACVFDQALRHAHFARAFKDCAVRSFDDAVG